MKHKLILLLILLLSFQSYAQKVTILEAQKVAKLAYKQMKSGMDSNTKTPIKLLSKNGNDTLLYVVPYEDTGFAIVSANKAAPPLLGFCEKGSLNLNDIPPGLSYFIEKFKYNLKRIFENRSDADIKTNELWNGYLNGIQQKSYTKGSVLVNSSWGQYDDYTLYTPNNYPAGCTAVAMAQILRYWATKTCCIEPSGWINYQGVGYTGAFANFGATTYNWDDMDPSDADDDNALLIFHAGASCATHYNSNASSSTPGRARDGFVSFWGISPNADVKWRISHLQNWENMLKGEIDLEHPLLYSAAQNVIGIGGEHSWIVDGYTTNNLFHCNWGWDEQPSNTWVNLGDWDPEDDGNPYNQYESAIFNVYPERTVGVDTPELSSQIFTYNPSGYILTVPEAFGATSYQWITDKGTITGNGTSATLYANSTANVQVRAYNSRCNIYSPYSSANISVNYGPISAPETVCYDGTTVSIQNVPSTTITWGGTNVNYPNGNTGTSVTVRASSSTISNTGTITASFTVDGSQKTITKNIWVGKPSLDVSEFIFTNGIGEEEYFCTSHLGNVFDLSASSDVADNFEVKLTNISGTQTYSQFTTSSGVGSMNLSSLSEGWYLFSARGYNTCGWGEWVETEIEFADCSQMMLMISPNPSFIETTVSIESYNMEEAFDEDLEWGLEVYDSGQNLKEKKNKLKGKSTKIKTVGWQEGVYVVRVKYKDKILTEKLVVKK
jgi:hypothetical protein